MFFEDLLLFFFLIVNQDLKKINNKIKEIKVKIIDRNY